MVAKLSLTTPPLMLVEWRDSASCHYGWTDPEKLPNASPSICYSVGFVITRLPGDDGFIVLAQNLSDWDHAEHKSVSMLQVIPLACVIKETKLG